MSLRDKLYIAKKSRPRIRALIHTTPRGLWRGKPSQGGQAHSEVLPHPRARADSRKLQVRRLKHLSVQESHSLKLPFPSTRLSPQLFPSSGNSFQKSSFHLANSYSSFMAQLHCSSSREALPDSSERIIA